MRRAALLSVVATGLVPGCFYVEPINQRPSITIVGEPTQAVYRGDHLDLVADADDPDGDYISYQWRAYACTGATEACDPSPFESAVTPTLGFDVPVQRADASPLSLLRVVLEARDELGATARPEEVLLIPVVNRAPSLVLDRGSRYSYVTGTPINVFAKVGDQDDGPAAVTIVEPWEVFGPAAATHTLVDLAVPADPADPDHRQVGKVFTPNAAGEWMLRVTAHDGLDGVAVETTMITVASDGPPCLAQLLPIVPTGGAALPVTDPTLFRVPIVIDDLDQYPPQSDNGIVGVTTFQWSLQAPGQATHVPITGATGNTYSLDPARFTPGDIVELRVQIYDRNLTAIPCVDGAQTCSVISQPSCIQRQTWRVEIR